MRTRVNASSPGYVFAIGYTDGSDGYNNSAVVSWDVGTSGIMAYGSKAGGYYYTRSKVYQPETWVHFCFVTKMNTSGFL